MRAAVYAHDIGRGPRFAREALRVHFAEGRSLETGAHVVVVTRMLRRIKQLAEFRAGASRRSSEAPAG